MGAFLVASIIGYVSTIAYLATRGRFFKCFIHCTWCLMSLLMIIAFILAALLQPVSTVMVETCDIMIKFLNNQSSANDLIPTDVSSKIG